MIETLDSIWELESLKSVAMTRSCSTLTASAGWVTQHSSATVTIHSLFIRTMEHES